MQFIRFWLELKLGRRAVTSLEYGLIAGVIVATIAAGFKSFDTALSAKFSNVGTSL